MNINGHIKILLFRITFIASDWNDRAFCANVSFYSEDVVKVKFEILKELEGDKKHQSVRDQISVAGWEGDHLKHKIISASASSGPRV